MKNNFKFYLLILIILLVSVFSLFSHEDESIAHQYENIRNIARFIGILSYFILGMTIFIGTSKRLLNQLLKKYNFLFIHKNIAKFSIFILSFHPLLIIYTDYIEETASMNYYLSNLSYYPFLFGVTAFILFVTLVLITQYLIKSLKFKIWINIHRLSIIAYILASIHLLNYATLSGLYAYYPVLNIFLVVSNILVITGIGTRVYVYLKKSKK